MKQIGTLFTRSFEDTFNKQIVFKSRRDELVAEFVSGINAERVGTSYKPVTARTVAMKLRLNPFLSKDDGEVFNLLKECREKGFKKFWWATSNKTK